LQRNTTELPKDPIPGFTTETFQQELVKTVVIANLPFRTVENPQFRYLINMLHSNVIVPSANTLRRSIHDYSQGIIMGLKRIIPWAIQVHIATGTWTSTNGLAFAGTTVHFIDAEWAMREEVIGFQALGGASHTGKFLAEKLTEILGLFDLAQRMLCLVTDNAQSNYVLARELQGKGLGQKWNPDQYHLSCFAHVLALASKAFMENLKSQPVNKAYDHNQDPSINVLQQYPSGSFSRTIFKVSVHVAYNVKY